MEIPIFYFWHFVAVNVMKSLVSGKGRSSQDYPVDIADYYSVYVIGYRIAVLTIRNHGIGTKY